MASDQESGIGNRESGETSGTGRGPAEGGRQERGTGNRLTAPRRQSKHLRLESRLPLIVLAGGSPAVIVSLVWLWTGEHGIEVRWTLSVIVIIAWLTGAALA